MLQFFRVVMKSGESYGFQPINHTSPCELFFLKGYENERDCSLVDGKSFQPDDI